MPAPSPRAWEPDFIRLWESGATQAQIAAALATPQGTVKSRAHRLQQQGTIQARPRGGLLPVQTPGQTTDTGAAHSADTDAEQRTDTGAVSSVDIGAGHSLDTAAGRSGHRPDHTGQVTGANACP
jgi:hypothetical protein